MTVFHYASIFSPILLSVMLCYFGFEIDTEKLLAIFLPVVWSILFALGGSILFLRSRRAKGDSYQESDQRLSNYIIQLSIILMFQTACFLVMSTAYPAKDYLTKLFMTNAFLVRHFSAIHCAYESTLFSLIVIPSMSSLIVGGWCLYIALNLEQKA